MNTPLRVAIIGLGAAGCRRAAAVQALHPLYELVAVCDVRTVEAPAGVPTFTDYRQMLARGPAVDAVVVCTTNDVMCEVVKDVLTSGKHVFCEKPAGRSLQEAEEMATVARAASGRLAFGFNHRHHGSVRHALEIARSGELGRLIFARGVYGKSGMAGWRADRKVAGGGILLDQGIHLLDLARQFCGEFTDVRAMAGAPQRSGGTEENVFALLRTASGAVAALHSSATQWRHTFHLELAYSEGSLLLDGLVTGSRSYLAADGAAEALTVRRGRGAQCSTARRTFEEDDSWERELSAFASAVRDGTDDGLCDIDDALDVMRLVGSVYDAVPIAGAPGGAARHFDAITSYRARLAHVLSAAAWDKLEELSRLCLAAHSRGRTIWLAGNGGSAATAAHWAADLCHAFQGGRGLRAIALGQNIALITATANDRGYEYVFSEEIRGALNAGDVVVAISASGNSPNILRLLEHAAEHGAHTVAVTGFDGGAAAKNAQLAVDAPSEIEDYGPVEDVHMALGHALRERVAELAAHRTDVDAVTA